MKIDLKGWRTFVGDAIVLLCVGSISAMLLFATIYVCAFLWHSTIKLFH